jgi:regulator of nonsense transcripts 2
VDTYVIFSLSELLYLPLPSLPTISQKSDSILIGSNNPNHLSDDSDDILVTGGKWEDEEERRFFEDIQDLKDFVPSSVLGIDEAGEEEGEEGKEKEKERLDREKEEVRKLEEELQKLDQETSADAAPNGGSDSGLHEEE